MGGYKGISRFILGLFITLFAWSMCLAYAQKIQHLESTVEIRYREGQFNLEMAENLQKGEDESDNKIIKSFVAWNQLENKSFQNIDMQKVTNGDILQVYGNMSMLISNEKVNGKQLYVGETEGAIITEPIAYELWGSIDVLGKEFKQGDKTYSVKGVIDDKDSYVILQIDTKEKETAFSALRIDLLKKENIAQQISLLGVKYQTPQGVMSNLSLRSQILSQLALLPGWIIGFYALAKLYRVLYKNYSYWVATIFLGILIIPITWLMLNIIQFRVYIPSEFIPNKWSDFEFWSQLMKDSLKNKETIESLPVFLPDKWYMQVKNTTIATFCIAMLGIGVGIRRIQILSLKELFWKIIIVIVLSFGVIMLVYGLGHQVTITKAFWLVIPASFGIQFMVMSWTKMLKE